LARLKAVRRRIPRAEAGQGLAEYALILALIAVAAIVAITFMGSSINTMLSSLGNSF
jgi:pilus assembly protein Flp/PilA